MSNTAYNNRRTNDPRTLPMARGQIFYITSEDLLSANETGRLMLTSQDGHKGYVPLKQTMQQMSLANPGDFENGMNSSIILKNCIHYENINQYLFLYGT